VGWAGEEVKTMAGILLFVIGLLFTTQAFIGLCFLLSSIWEKEKRASAFAVLQFLGMLGFLILFLVLWKSRFYETGPGVAALIAALILVAVAAFFLLRRTAPNETALKGTMGHVVGQVKRYDEREIMFARNRSLRPGSEEYKTFYGQHPELEAYDTHRRERGGPLGQTGSTDRPADGPNVAAAMASLSIPMHLSRQDQVKPHPHPVLKGKKFQLPPEQATERVKGYALHLGADLVGITEINPLWIYSHRGEIFHENWEDWGKEIAVSDRRYAIVFATEMDSTMVGAAPHTPTVVESMFNYGKGAYIATQLAAFVANLGYSAAANHLRHYEALLVPLAVDAGLGETGRLGYLITKEFGPRIRLGAVTTDLPLVADKPVDIGVEEFCRICKKCALCCPSQSIPTGERMEVNGSLRWKLNAETCFDYWGKIGTDCNICMRVCPWSHGRTFPHRLIVELVSRNKGARGIFSVMDDIFYGKKPKSKTPPPWAGYTSVGEVTHPPRP
jgi:reductive dehalogenase